MGIKRGVLIRFEEWDMENLVKGTEMVAIEQDCDHSQNKKEK